jgi:[ribosomal protein S5]-alanine N-acetyltransferase
MEIKTKRLILRDVEKKDINDFVSAGNSKEINYFTAYIPYPLTPEKAEKMIKRMIEQGKSERRRHSELAITLKGEKKVIGMINLYDIDYNSRKCKIGYWIGHAWRRRGYTEEACIAIISYAFKKLEMNKISATTLTDNIFSNNLLKKLGFKKLATCKQDRLIGYKFYDCFLWEKFRKA